MDKIKKFRISSESRQCKEYDANSNCVVKSKKKKLSLTKELMGGIEHFKKALTMGFQKKNKNVDFLDPIKRENVKVDCEDKHKAKQLWNVSLKALEQLIAKERRLRQDYEMNLIRHLDRLKELDRAKGEHAKQLEQTLADEDRVIAALRADIKNTNDEFENCRQTFFRFYMESFGRSTLLDAARAFSRACESAELAVTAAAAAAAATTTTSGGQSTTATAAQIRTMIAGMQDRLRSLIADAASAPRNEIVRAAAAASGLGLVPVAERDVNGGGGDGKDWLAVWYAAVSAQRNNVQLESVADTLDRQTNALRDRLHDAYVRHDELSAHKNERQIAAVALDEFCAVTEEINAQQMRSLEFSRLLAVDDDDDDDDDDDELLKEEEDMEKIRQLKEKIAQKKLERQRLLDDRAAVKSQVDAYKSRYEELTAKKNRLTEDVLNVQKSPSKLLNQSELLHHQAYHDQQQRAKHLKQLKIQYNKMTNVN